ncbi:MAG: CDP-diacylglycerol--serine O-phosphatidyltransferase [Gammaproteobacteria bacterium]|nr:CDP-diacylglycerol--serine O-phosphatidyltransferase [Gammaproteobacteria bacterium]
MSNSEPEQVVVRKKPSRGIYLLPNLFTTGCLFSGFYAIVSANAGNFEAAAAAIFIAMVLDGLDGRVARLTNTASEFGVQYDSLADMVSFGVAPALVMYLWAFSDMGKLGWVVAFVYTAATALRLARFNTQAEVADKRFFQGLPSPSAAAVVAGLIWLGVDYGIEGKDIAVLAMVITLFAGLLMVSNFRYYSFKDIDFKGKVPFFTLLVAVMVFVFISLDPPQILFGIFMLYLVSGLVLTIWGIRQKRTLRAKEAD